MIKKDELEAVEVVEAAELVDIGEELVELTIPFDYSRPMDTQISIQVNGETIIIQRGVKVQVKRKFAEVYNNSELQRGRAMAMMNSIAQQ